MNRQPDLQALERLDPARFDTPPILKQLVAAHRRLAEFKGVVATIPNRNILISTLGLQEAKDSSAIENIVTTHDELFRDTTFPDAPNNPAVKEVLRYRQALTVGFEGVRKAGLLTVNQIIAIQAELEQNKAGLRKLPGTALKDGAGRVVYTPPQNPDEIVTLLGQLEHFINDPDASTLDPLIKMALIHHRFESIHPFYDGNGRSGRIINVLYLVQQGLLDIPVLYLSRHIVRSKADYYRLLQSVRDAGNWEDWVLYMLTAIERTALDGIGTIHAMRALMQDLKQRIRAHYRFYSQDLINNLMSHPYTKIDFIRRDLKVSRLTATRYLDQLADGGFLHKQKIGRSNYYVNPPLFRILAGESD
ncbi:MAG: Fic family protein [Dokdonella sp.]|uniref:Fic family protein n=1 Tax=Dokdonella sp. TaxID=2291710 RepID=UPI0025C242BB|nr:Fic family protein [Dokdonella sp.]MBZ0223416.1 Fic family protein [Dokdonella sp.]MCC7256560.1 Fic family protein [Dokdonella sp.]